MDPHLLLLDTNPIAEAFLAGMVFGVVLAASMDKAYELIKSGLDERRHRRGDKVNWFKRTFIKMRDALGVVGAILLINALIWSGIGAFQIYAYAKQKQFANCQADFNQKSSIARDVRADAATSQQATLYAWIESIPALLGTNGDKPSQSDIAFFHETLLKAISTYNRFVATQQSHPYPPNPQNTCGSN